MRRAASTEDGARGGRLDRTLVRLLRVLDGSSRATERLPALEELVGFIQAAAMQAASRAAAAPTASAGQPMEVDAAGAEAAAAAAAISARVRELAEATGEGPAGGEPAGAAAALAACLGRVQSSLAAETAGNGASAGPGARLVDRAQLSSAQLGALADLDAVLRQEYRLRRQMILERVVVTLQSFARSPKVRR